MTTAAQALSINQAWLWFKDAPLHVLAILVIAIVILWVGRRAITRIISRVTTAPENGSHHHQRRRERAMTMGSILRSTMNAAIGVVALVMILGELGLNVAPIIASASVLGLAVSLGAQNIVKDMVSGIFMLFEDQYGVGDHIIINESEGTVESVGLRVTTVRSTDGTLWYVRNGEILKLGNKSQP
ncbi:MAG: small-conductance mechanosensitive channel [Actinobacteria bacterium]|nr:MAG: small-conductance mechanosensitive channel [Actinomycetota bacterium]